METGIEKAFENALLVINDMTDDALRIKEKYGSDSKLLERKLHELEVVKNLYKQAAEYINTTQDKMHIMEVNHKVLEVMALKEDAGLPWRNVGVILGDPNPQRWEFIDRIDTLIANVKAVDKKCPSCPLRAKG